MSHPPFTSVFPRQLRYWTLHCTLNALPSFCITTFFMGLSKSPAAVAAMLLAIGTFVLSYATLTSLPGPMLDEDHVLSRALRVGIKARGWLSAFSLLILPLGGLMATPDLWVGYFSAVMVDAGARQIGFRGRLVDSPDLAGFSEVLITTMLEGFILSFLLLMISFFAVMFLQARDSRRFFAVADPR